MKHQKDVVRTTNHSLTGFYRHQHYIICEWIHNRIVNHSIKDLFIDWKERRKR